MRDEKKITLMREGGGVLVEIMREILSEVSPGVTTKELDNIAQDLCDEHKVIPAFTGYQGYPAVLCVGPNDIVVHGIPDGSVLKEGDIISIDMGIIYKDVYLDMARTVGVGTVSDKTRIFVNTVKDALVAASKAARIGNTVGDIGHAIQSTVEANGYSVVSEMVGHGVGYALHEDPPIPGYGEKGEGEVLCDGQTIAIEAIVNQGTGEIDISEEDGWTSRTKDGMLSALFENTVVVSEESEILTPLSLQEL